MLKLSGNVDSSLFNSRSPGVERGHVDRTGPQWGIEHLLFVKDAKLGDTTDGVFIIFMFLMCLFELYFSKITKIILFCHILG